LQSHPENDTVWESKKKKVKSKKVKWENLNPPNKKGENK
jgi:hypothetical protein